MTTAKDANRNTWYMDRLIGEPEHAELQDNIVQGLLARSVHQIGWGLIGASGDLALASTPADLRVNIAPAKMVTPFGYLVQWTTSQNVDISSATQGTVVGDTSTPTVGTKRYIVAAVGHEYDNQESAIDRLGVTKYYRQVSQPKFDVWMSSPVTSADDPITSTILRSLLTSIVDAGYAPVALAIRNQGDTSIANDAMFPIARMIGAYAEDADDSAQLMQHLLASALVPLVLNVAGTVAITPEAVVGAPGKITFTGGERIAFGIAGDQAYSSQYANDKYHNRIIVQEIPAGHEVTFPTENERYVVRAFVDPATLDMTIYKGTGDFPNDTAQPNNAHGTEGGTNQGFVPTWIDIPLAVVTTGANGTVPTITQLIANDWRSKLAYIDAQAALVASKADLSDVQPVLTEFTALRQPYVIPPSQPLITATGALDISVAQVSIVGGHADGISLVPALAPSTTLTLADNTTSLIYADMTEASPVPKAVDLTGGGSLVANPKYVVLGVVQTLGGAVTRRTPAMCDKASLDGELQSSYMRAPGATTLYVGPTRAKQRVSSAAVPYSAPGTKYFSEFETSIDKSIAANWYDNTIVAGEGWRYIYADPGGSHSGNKAIVLYKIGADAPTYMGRHPDDENLLFIGAGYVESSGDWREFSWTDGNVTIDRTEVLSAGGATVNTAVPLQNGGFDVVPPTAVSVILEVDQEIGGAPFNGYTSISGRFTGTDYARARIDGAAGEGRSTTGIEVPIEWNAGTPRIAYQNSASGMTVSIHVVGYRERQYGNQEAGTLPLIGY